MLKSVCEKKKSHNRKQLYNLYKHKECSLIIIFIEKDLTQLKSNLTVCTSEVCFSLYKQKSKYLYFY